MFSTLVTGQNEIYDHFALFLYTVGYRIFAFDGLAYHIQFFSEIFIDKSA